MSAMSDYLENKLVDFLLRSGTFTKPSTIYVALFTSNPTDAGGGTEVSTSSTGYARVQVGPGDTAWNATQGGTSGNSSGTGGLTDNAADIVFGTPTTNNWGTVTGWGLFDASTGGNLLIWGALGTPKAVNAGDSAPRFQAGAIDITFA